MSVPTSLGLVASGAVYLPYTTADAASPLLLTTDVDIPASTFQDPVAIIILLRFATRNRSGAPTNPVATSYVVSDDAAGPGDPNVYLEAPLGDSGALSYGFGIPTVHTFPAFDISVNGTNFDGGSEMATIVCTPTRKIPAGSTIEIDFAGNYPASPPTTLVSATVLAAVDANPAVSVLSAQTIDPSNTGAGDGSATPLGDRAFSDIASGVELLVAHAWADDSAIYFSHGFSPGDTPAIDGSQTIDDSSGNWTKVDSGGYASTSAYGGLIYSVFTADASAIDLADGIVQFLISDGINYDGQPTGGDFEGGPFAGLAIFKLSFLKQAPPPALNGVVPV